MDDKLLTWQIRTQCPSCLLPCQPWRDHLRSLIFLTIGRLTRFTPFHRNKGTLAAFHHFLSGGQRGTKAGTILPRAVGHRYSPRGTRQLQPFPLSPKGIYSARFSLPCQCQNCDLHGKAAKIRIIQGWWLTLATGRPPGKRGSSDHLPTWLPTISRVGQKQPISPSS